MALSKKILAKWDWWIYWRAFHSLRRMCARNPGMAYLIELHLRDYREQHQLNDDLKISTELFYRAYSETNKTHSG